LKSTKVFVENQTLDLCHYRSSKKTKNNRKLQSFSKESCAY